MLRLVTGEPVWDEEDIPVLVGLSTILSVLEERKAQRLSVQKAPVQTSAAIHSAEFGHALRFGCCKPQRRSKVPLRTRREDREA